MIKCSACGRELTNAAHIAEGIGPVCKHKQARAGRGASEISDPAMKVCFMSSPRTTLADRRSYLVNAAGEPHRLVHIYPGRENVERTTADCECDVYRRDLKCVHIQAVGPIDANKFFKAK
jgi:hypothetical protein